MLFFWSSLSALRDDVFDTSEPYSSRLYIFLRFETLWIQTTWFTDICWNAPNWSNFLIELWRIVYEPVCFVTQTKKFLCKFQGNGELNSPSIRPCKEEGWRYGKRREKVALIAEQRYCINTRVVFWCANVSNDSQKLWRAHKTLSAFNNIIYLGNAWQLQSLMRFLNMNVEQISRQRENNLRLYCSCFSACVYLNKNISLSSAVMNT